MDLTVSTEISVHPISRVRRVLDGLLIYLPIVEKYVFGSFNFETLIFIYLSPSSNSNPNTFCSSGLALSFSINLL